MDPFTKYNNLDFDSNAYNYPLRVDSLKKSSFDFNVPLVNTSGNPHKEASNTTLASFFALVILLAIITCVVAGGEIALVRKCEDKTTLQQSFFYISIFSIIIAVTTLGFSLNGIIKRIGFKPKNT